VDKLLLRATDGKYDYSTQIKPWFAGQLAVAVPNLPASGNAASGVPTHLLVLATVTDATKAGDWVKSVIGSTSSTMEAYGGVSLSIVTRNGHSGAFGVKGQVLLVGDLDSVKAAIDAESAGSLRDSDQLKRAASSLPGDHLAFVYVDNKRLLALASQNPALTGEAGQTIAELQACVTGNVSWSAGTVRADGRTLVMETATPKESEVVSRESTLSRVAPHLPASTVAVLDIHDVGKLALGMLDHCRSLPRIADALKSIDTQVNALGGYASYLGWIGDTDLVVTRDGTAISGGVVGIAADKAGAVRLATQVRNLIALAGSREVSIKDEEYGGTTITTISAADAAVIGTDASIAFAIRDDLVVIGVGTDFVKHVLDVKSGASLADLDRYRQALGRVEGTNEQQVFVDVSAVRAAIEAAVPARSIPAEYQTEYKPYLEPFDLLVGSTTTRDDLVRASFVLIVK
jgi:hypothetical protein